MQKENDKIESIEQILQPDQQEDKPQEEVRLELRQANYIMNED